MTIVVHTLDPQRVAEAVTHRLAKIEESRQRAYAGLEETLAAHARTVAEGKTWRGVRVPRPEDRHELTASYDQAVAREQTHYARVRVVEDQGAAHVDRPFFLVYGDLANQGPSRTGGFTTAQAAERWFMNSGR